MRLLWKVARGDRYILERATYADQMKYMCLGGVVAATGLMAALAGGYAFYTIFAPKGDALDKIKMVGGNPEYIPPDIQITVLSIVFGLLWGLIIFNIDRFIVTSTGTGDGTEAITWPEFRGAIPRIIMGAIIALTISKPIEIRMFQSEINERLHHVQDSVITENIKQAEIQFEENAKQARQKLGKLNQNLDLKEQRLVFLDSMISLETDRGHCGIKCNEYKNQRQITENEILAIKNTPEFQQNQAEENSYREQLKDAKEEAKKKGKALDGLLIRIHLAHETAGTVISLFITLLFMAIELTPIFFKLMLVKTPYDYLSDNIKELVKAENGIEVRYDYYKDKQGQERHLIIHHQVERMIRETHDATFAQKVLIRHAVKKYIQEMKDKIDKNPAEFIKQHTNGKFEP